MFASFLSIFAPGLMSLINKILFLIIQTYHIYNDLYYTHRTFGSAAAEPAARDLIQAVCTPPAESSADSKSARSAPRRSGIICCFESRFMRPLGILGLAAVVFLILLISLYFGSLYQDNQNQYNLDDIYLEEEDEQPNEPSANLGINGRLKIFDSTAISLMFVQLFNYAHILQRPYRLGRIALVNA